MPYKDPTDPRRKAARARWLAKPGNKEKDLAYSNKSRERWRKTPEGRAKVNAYNARSKRKNADKVLVYNKTVWPRINARLELRAGRPRPTVCDVCGGVGDKKGIVFDHCHQKGHFRGWLCSACNKILGFANDDPERLLRLVAYLRRTAVSSHPQLTLPGI